jgi:tRNA-specific 2-thiouridylase
MKQKVLVAMSGGVDSSVAAFLLLEAGFDVAGVTMRLFSEEDGASGQCPADNVKDAKNVATALGIEHFVFDLSAEFKRQVMDRFAQGYLHGETPNPCVDCNRLIKFGLLFERAREMGFDNIATGHYVRRDFDEKASRWLLKKGLDHSKDQSYVLYSLTLEQLSKTIFPLGELSKEEVRNIAETHRFVNANRPDSQDICFIPGGDYRSFLESVYEVKSPEAALSTKTAKFWGTTGESSPIRRDSGADLASAPTGRSM